MSDHAKERTVCYFATSYVLVGLLLAYAMFAHKLNEFDIFPMVMLFCTAPIIAFCGGLLTFGVSLLTGNIAFALIGLAATSGAWGVWRGVKYAIYDRWRIRLRP